MPDNRMVAVCDVLGYSNLVREHSLEELRNYHLRNILTVIESSIPKHGVNLESVTQLELLKTGAVGHVSFSDTIVIYSLLDDRDGRKNVLDAVYRLISIPMNTPYYRYRVGIAYGEMYVNKDEGIYIGKALVDAHDIEAMQQWSGAVLTESAARMFKDCYPETSMLVDYDVPIKGQTRRRCTVVNWTLARHEIVPSKTNWMWRVEDDERVTHYKDPEIEQKIRNTEEFHLDKCVQCRAKKT
jgi:class 3 adenylate cyclase